MGSDDKVNDSSDNHPLTSSNQQTIVLNEHLHAEATTFACTGCAEKDLTTTVM